MSKYQVSAIEEVAQLLSKRFKSSGGSTNVLKAPELRALYAKLPTLPNDQKAKFGKELNDLKKELTELVNSNAASSEKIKPIDVTAPFDVNLKPNTQPRLLDSYLGSEHPLMKELDLILDIFSRMGFTSVESRQIDDDFHMFGSLNFPEGHPARDDYDTFTTKEGLVAPAHVSIMQNRNLVNFRSNLERGEPISVVYAGRSFRNEDVDARHDHTFYQVEITCIDKNINAGNLIATFKTFLETYYEQPVEVKMQPFYFPFTEPSFEMSLSCPFCQKKGCNVCSYSGWIELLGMGMIHPNVLKMGGVDPNMYSGFAGGLGLERLVMMKYDIDDIRYFESGNLEFLRQFK
ncbi:MAG TPA: phenylalanine--tRNA ligase subunit alpha [Candidatus Saccharimonadales bacterium]|nr:phenylalanine--tRNA ligase subunit alpha [Candidatus Saccharimonadales bacterium]